VTDRAEQCELFERACLRRVKGIDRPHQIRKEDVVYLLRVADREPEHIAARLHNLLIHFVPQDQHVPSKEHVAKVVVKSLRRLRQSFWDRRGADRPAVRRAPYRFKRPRGGGGGKRKRKPSFTTTPPPSRDVGETPHCTPPEVSTDDGHPLCVPLHVVWLQVIRGLDTPKEFPGLLSLPFELFSRACSYLPLFVGQVCTWIRARCRKITDVDLDLVLLLIRTARSQKKGAALFSLLFCFSCC